MDTTTHGLTGYIIAKTGIARDTGKWGTIAGVSAAVLPDIDLVLGFLGTEFSLKYHRHLTNSVFLIIPLSLLLAWVFVKISKIKRFGVFFLIAVVEITAHNFMDLMTSYGTMILSPLSSQRFALDWVFIVDLFLASALLLPFIGLFIWRGRTQRLARVSVLLAGLYIGLCAYNHSWALSLANGYARANGLVAAEVASLPQPLSPFRWANYIQTEGKIYHGFVDLIGKVERDPDSAGNFLSRFLARYQPISRLQYKISERFDRSPWVDKAVRLEGTKTFFWFARFPVARYRPGENGNHRVEFFDLRFGTMNDYKPFMYVVDFNPQGDVVFEGFL
jgi:inner membrane protein